MEREIEIKVEYKDTFEVHPLQNLKKVSVRENCIEGSRIDIQNHLTRDVENTFQTIEVLYDRYPPRLSTLPRNTKHQVDGASEGRRLMEEPRCFAVSTDRSNTAGPPADASPPSQSSESSNHVGVEDYKQSYLTNQPTWYRYINEYGKMQCKFCDRTFNLVSTLQFHIKKSHPKEAISLKKAMTKYKRGSKIFCRLCMMNFDTLDMLKSHVTKRHLIEDDKFICDYCKEDFPSKYEIINHIKDKHMDSEGNFYKAIRRKLILKRIDKERYQCPYCEYLSKRNYTLTRHMKVKHTTEEDLTFHCPLCDYRAPLKYYLQSHIVAKHPETNYAKSKPKHVCDICGYGTVKRSHYVMHRRQHFPDKTHKCESCDYQTNFLANFNDHKRIHTKEKPYSCDVEGCNYICAAKTGITGHKLKHDPDRPMWYCEICTYKTMYKGSLKKHINAHNRNSQKIRRKNL